MNVAESWRARILLTAFLALFYIFCEWLFFLTKPSSLSLSPWSQGLVVLATAPVLPMLFAAAIVILCGVFSLLWNNPINRTFWHYVSFIPASVILASTFFLLIDNFTVTLFEFGIRSVEFPATILYVALFIFLIAVSFRWIRQWELQLANRITSRKLSAGLICLIALLLVMGLIGFMMARPKSSFEIADSKERANLPGILFIGSDGINADHMSAYGYKKDTTPNISKFAKDALVFNNAYANASRTLASLVSLLSGRLPTATGVICPPDILHGEDVYQHFPGILRRHHYRSIQLTVRGYGDASDANMRMAFDSVNFRSSDELIIFEWTQRWMTGESSYLLHQMYERLSERLLHIFGIRKMSDPFAEIMGAKRDTYSDSQKLDELLRFMDSSKEPFFAHIHFMGTHRNKIKTQASSEKSADQDSQDDIPSFYDDAIKKFDQNFEQVIRFLKESGRLDSTIIVLYSDHGWKHATRVRVPLMIRFPKRAYNGLVQELVQNIDITPTILDYLKIPKPDWMTGQSLISKTSIDPCRPVISVWPIRTYDQQLKWKHREEAKAPFYTLGAVSVVTCRRSFKYDLEKRKLSGQPITYTDQQCGGCPSLERRDVVRFVLNHLRENGYDIGTLE